MTKENDIRLAYISTLLDGGYTVIANAEPIINPKSGYVVGGGALARTIPMLQETMDVDAHALLDGIIKYNYAEFEELWLKYTNYVEENWCEGMGVGTWIHEGKIYFDVVELFDDIKGASFHGRHRGEIALWDCKNQKEITL
jgi:hypothetical protein